MEPVGILTKLILAVLVGGIIGAEREYRSKLAGFRTLIMICLGATLFTIFSRFIAAPSEVSRVASNVVVGIGFVGAGVIFKGDNNRVNGITTAATIWVTAALGVGIGAGYYIVSFLGCLFVLLTHIGFPYLESVIDKANRGRNYKIVYPYPEFDEQTFTKLFKEFGLHAKEGYQSKKGSWIVGEWLLYGRQKNHDRFVQHILKEEKIEQFDF